MVRFEYVEPADLNNALTFLAGQGNEARILAGGTDLLKHLKERTIRPRYIVNIKMIPDLFGITSVSGNGLKIGSLSTISDVENSPALKNRYQALADAAHRLGSPQVRNLATIGGNLCNASPSAETAPSMLAFSASLVISSSKGERSIPVASFFKGPGATCLEKGEILAGIVLPEPPHGTGSAYIKLSPRGAMDLAVVGVAALVVLSEDGGVVSDCRIALGAVAPTPIRANEAEGLLRGKRPDDRLLHEAAEAAAGESRPISDIRASAGYRREMVKVLTVSALEKAIERAKSACNKP